MQVVALNQVVDVFDLDHRGKGAHRRVKLEKKLEVEIRNFYTGISSAQT